MLLLLDEVSAVVIAVIGLFMKIVGGSDGFGIIILVGHGAEEIEGGRGRGVKWDVEVEIRDPICISII